MENSTLTWMLNWIERNLIKTLGASAILFAALLIVSPWYSIEGEPSLAIVGALGVSMLASTIIYLGLFPRAGI